VVLRHAPEAIGRAAAARELGSEGSPQATAALRDAMLTDKFWGVQGDAATALGTIRTTAALDALLEGLKLPHPKVRRAVARALGNFRGDKRAASALAEVVAKGDESYFVEAEAVLSLGKTRDERAFAHLTEALKRDSYLEVIRTHAIAGMAELRDERAIDIARDYSAYGRPARARVAAVGTLARFAALKENRRVEILDLMAPLVDDREFMVRMRIPSAFSEVGDPRALPALRRLADRDLDGRIQRHANDAITAISEGRSRVEEGQRLREDIDKLRDDNKKLQERLEKIEAVARDKPA
jgi:aminopeptidase N